jgi:hypothetical protein
MGLPLRQKLSVNQTAAKCRTIKLNVQCDTEAFFLRFFACSSYWRVWCMAHQNGAWTVSGRVNKLLAQYSFSLHSQSQNTPTQRILISIAQATTAMLERT